MAKNDFSAESAENYEQKCLCVLVLDVSGSMSSTSNGNDPYVYSKVEKTSWSYNDIGSETYYYKTNYGYQQVRRGSDNDWWSGTTTYYLYYGGGYYATHIGTDQTSASAVIYEGPLYRRITKLQAMQEAVSAFVDIIVENESELDLEEGETGNQISIVKFASSDNIDYFGSESSLAEGNNRQRNTGYNYTEVVKQFTPVSTGAQSLKDAADELQGGGGTMANYGMIKAKYLLADLVEKNPDRESVKTVVLFTDGEPGLRGYDATTADATVAASYVLKHDYDATVFTVGVFGDDVDSRVDSYMSYTSSDHPDAQAVGTGGEPGGYYQKASEELNISEIFTTIAHGAGGTNASLGTATEVRDVVSNSFSIPEGTEKSDIHVFTSAISYDGMSWGDLVPLTLSDDDIVIDGSKVSVTGFNYGSAENFVGKRLITGHSGESDDDWYWAGKKLVIKFNIEADPEATGGVGSATNTPESGVYVNGERINKYDVPHTTLPVNIKILKNGLRHGESATFEIWRIKPKKDAQGNIVYNAIGKPVPDEKFDLPEDDDLYETNGWEKWSKVIVTNMGENGNSVTKVLSTLDPSWVYRVVEDDWGWAYKLEASSEGTMTTSDVELNPFEYTNTEKQGVAKHAEAVAVNHFATTAEGEASTESAKSSKVESF